MPRSSSRGVPAWLGKPSNAPRIDKLSGLQALQVSCQGVKVSPREMQGPW
jgi:hypothetical protein